MSDTNRPQINRFVDSSLRDRIAAILHAHTLAENDPVFWRCCCTAYSDSFKDDYIAHDAHVADAVIADLGLRRESRPNDYDHRNYPDGDRYITKWIGADDE